jgi:hypothetical protein
VASRTLTVRVTGTDAGASKALGNVGKQAHKTGGILQELKSHAGALVAGFVGFEAIKKGAEFLVDATKAAADDQAQLAILANQSNKAGVSWKTHGKAIEETITKMSGATGFMKGDLTNSFGRLVTATHSASQSTKLLGDAENIARARHIDLQTASQILIKANMGNAGALKKLGIATVTVTKQQDALKKRHDALTLSGHKFTAAENIAYKAQMISAKAADKQASAIKNLSTIHKTYAGAAKAFSGTAAGQLAILGAKWEEVKIKVGNVILPLLTRFGMFLSTALPAAFAKVSGFISRNIATFKLLGEAVAVAGAAVLAYMVVTATISAASAIYGALKTAIFLARNAQIALNVAMEMNPIGVVIGLLTLLAVGVYIAYQRSTTFRNIVQGAFRVVKEAAVAALGWITHTGIPAVIAAWNSAKPVISLLARVAKVEFHLIEGFVRTMVAVVKPLMSGDFSGAFDAAKGAVAGVYSKVKSVVKDIPTALTSALDKIGTAAGKVGGKVFDGIMGGIGDIGGTIKDKIVAAVNFVIKRINSALAFRASVDTHVPGVGKIGIGWGGPHIPTLATGGIVNRPTLAVIGERGPEAVVPLHRGGFGGMTVNFHHTPADADPQAIAAAIAWKTRRLAG